MALAEEMRFGFGRNWAEFVDTRLNDGVIEDSRRHMAGLLRLDDLRGKVFLDIGCGSGIHSLAALRLGAEHVISFDYDPDSVATTKRVRSFAGDPANWEVVQGSVLDAGYMASLPKADIVYSWGVLHHTGDMRRAIRCAADRVAPGGMLIIALYRRTPLCGLWRIEKRLYVAAPQPVRRVIEALYAAAFRAAMALRGRSFRAYVEGYVTNRGMNWMTDVRDWLGGYPYESISEADMLAFAAELGLTPVRRFCHRPGIGLFGTGCDEYVFARPG